MINTASPTQPDLRGLVTRISPTAALGLIGLGVSVDTIAEKGLGDGTYLEIAMGLVMFAAAIFVAITEIRKSRQSDDERAIGCDADSAATPAEPADALAEPTLAPVEPVAAKRVRIGSWSAPSAVVLILLISLYALLLDVVGFAAATVMFGFLHLRLVFGWTIWSSLLCAGIVAAATTLLFGYWLEVPLP